MWVAKRLLFVLEFFICVFFCMLLSTVPFMVKKEKSNWKNVFYRGGRGRGVMVLLKNVFMLGMPAMNLAPHYVAVEKAAIQSISKNPRRWRKSVQRGGDFSPFSINVRIAAFKTTWKSLLLIVNKSTTVIILVLFHSCYLFGKFLL